MTELSPFRCHTWQGSHQVWTYGLGLSLLRLAWSLLRGSRVQNCVFDEIGCPASVSTIDLCLHTPCHEALTALGLRAGSRLLASCSNGRHYLLNALRPAAQPLAAFSGHVNGSFYIRACFSPDGAHVLSGSSDHKAYIWEVALPQPFRTSGSTFSSQSENFASHST